MMTEADEDDGPREAVSDDRRDGRREVGEGKPEVKVDDVVPVLEVLASETQVQADAERHVEGLGLLERTDWGVAAAR